jgi:threonine efflux protein
MSHLIPILIAYSLAAISPGPSAILVMEYASFGPRRLARMLALGVSSGSFMWVAAVAFGLGALLRAFPGLAAGLRYASAALLSYFLIKTVIAVAKPRQAGVSGKGFVAISPGAAFTRGFLINLLNPAALVFFLSLFAPMLTESQDTRELGVLVAGVTAISLTWYQSLVTLVSHPRVQPFLLSGERWFRAGFAGLYLYFLIRLLVRA